MRKRFVLGAALGLVAIGMPAATMARDVLGVFQRWGAFRDAGQARCFAVAQPLAGGWEASPRRPFAAAAYGLRQGPRG